MHNLTDRQAEALAQRVLGLNLRQRLDGSFTPGGSAALSGMIGRLDDAGLFDRRAGKVTLEGLDALEANLGKLPIVDPSNAKAVPIERVREAIKAAREKLEAATREAEEEDRRDRQERELREAEKAAAIPAKLAELAVEHGLDALVGLGHAVPQERLVAFWRAIVDADASL
jgi:hypothetical protein